MRLIIISGLSGSGKSVAINTLEDDDYYCIDNMPLSMLPICVEHLTSTSPSLHEKVAIGVDARNVSQDISSISKILEQLKRQGINIELIYLEANEETLIQRYSETRRKHPLTKDGLPLIDAIKREKQILEEVILLAALRIDTTSTNVRQLRSLISEHVNTENTSNLTILLQSFGYKYGVPTDSDYVFDVRCLPNPYWEQKLRKLTGHDQNVIDYLQSHEEVKQMINSIRNFVEQWLPHFEKENRSYLSISIGCTGGQHRSVHIAEVLADLFQKFETNSVSVRHRNLEL